MVMEVAIVMVEGQEVVTVAVVVVVVERIALSVVNQVTGPENVLLEVEVGGSPLVIGTVEVVVVVVFGLDVVGLVMVVNTVDVTAVESVKGSVMGVTEVLTGMVIAMLRKVAQVAMETMIDIRLEDPLVMKEATKNVLGRMIDQVVVVAHPMMIAINWTAL